jgi:hypothetical protein
MTTTTGPDRAARARPLRKSLGRDRRRRRSGCTDPVARSPVVRAVAEVAMAVPASTAAICDLVSDARNAARLMRLCWVPVADATALGCCPDRIEQQPNSATRPPPP